METRNITRTRGLDPAFITMFWAIFSSKGTYITMNDTRMDHNDKEKDPCSCQRKVVD